MVDGPMRSYTEGTLVVIFRDAAAEKPVWSGWTTRRLETELERPTDEVKLEKTVRQVTKKLMKRYPPRALADFGKRQLWLTGVASERARRELEARGWRVAERVLAASE